MLDPAVGAVIVKHIDEMEAALRYANTTMQAQLEKSVAAVMDDKRVALGWAGAAPADFSEPQWLAPEEWRMGEGLDDDDFYLSFELDTLPCIDGHEPETWIGTIAGFAGAGIRLSANTDALGQRAWKALLKAQIALLDELVGKGFLCDPKTGDLALTISIDRERLAIGFEDGELEAALEPMALAIDRINAARPTLDRIVASIKQSADR